jgi:competence protein ComEC
VLLIPITLYYAILTGFETPIVRALLMSFVGVVGVLLGRQSMGLISIAVVGWLMLMFDPKLLTSVSFQLSFLATIGVVVVAPVISTNLRLPSILREDFSVSLSAQIMTIPVIVAVFGTISTLGLITNILILWTIPIIMVFATLALLVGLFSVFLGQIIMLIPTILTSFIIYLVSMMASIPFSIVEVGEIQPIFWLGYYLAVVGLVWKLNNSQKDDNLVE